MNDTYTQPHDRTRTETMLASVEGTIPLSPEDVFDYLSTLENNPQWNWSVTATTSLTPGPVGPGSRYLQASAAEPDHPQTLEVTRLERAKLLEVRAVGGRLAVTYRYEVQADDANTTRLKVRAEVVPNHPVGLPELYIQRLEASIRGNLDALRSILTPSHEEVEGARRPPAGPAMTDLPRLVLSYLGEDTYHRSAEDDDLRPACRPSRIRGVPAMRVSAERRGLRACPRCWPAESDSLPASNGR